MNVAHRVFPTVIIRSRETGEVMGPDVEVRPYPRSGAAKSIQSINAAAAVAVAAAVVVARSGLASPAATHSMKKLRVWHKTALFLSLSVFWSNYLFFPCPCSP